MNYPPYILARRLADKKAKNIEFHPSLNVNMTWLFWFPWFGIQLLSIALIFRSWPFLGIYALPRSAYADALHLGFDPMMRKILGKMEVDAFGEKRKNCCRATEVFKKE